MNADMTVQIMLTVTIKRLSVRARNVLPIFVPIRCATPVSNSAALTIHMPTTMGHPTALKPEYTADSFISGMKIPMASEASIATTLTGSRLHMNKTIVITVMIIATILESILTSSF